MKVAKWGNSLAIRIPVEAVGALDLKEGDDVEVRSAVGDRLIMTKLRSSEELRDAVRALRGRRPKGFKFNRDEANER